MNKLQPGYNSDLQPAISMRLFAKRSGKPIALGSQPFSKYVFLAVLLISLLPLIAKTLGLNLACEGFTGPLVHTLLEWVALLVTAFALLMALLLSQLRAKRQLLLICTALLAANGAGVVHAFVLPSLTGQTFSTDIATLMWSVNHSLGVGIVMISIPLGAWVGKRLRRSGTLLGLMVLLMVPALLAALMGLDIVAFRVVHWSRQVTPLLPLTLTLLAGLWVYPRYYKQHPNTFAATLILSAIPETIAHLHMQLGFEFVYDGHFNMAHALGILADFLALSGLLAEYRFRVGHLTEEVMRSKAVQVGLESQMEDRIRIQDELEGQRNLLEVTLAAIGEGIITADAEGCINFMNPVAERLTGWRLYEVSSCKLDKVFLLCHIDDRTMIDNPLENVLMGGLSLAVPPRRALLQEKQNQLIPIEYSSSPILSKQNLRIGSVVVFHDISDQRRVAAELSEARDRALAASNSKSEFLASVSHEIRTPMNAILGMVDLLMETALTQEQKKYVKTFKGASESLLLLINDILDVSVMESGHIHLECMPFDLQDLIEVQVNLFMIESNKKSLKLAYEIRNDVPNLLVGDAGRLGQILFNLVSNAIKFTHSGEVNISVKNAKNGFIHFAVADTGIGISRDKQVKIFEIFTQADTSTTREYGGTGLGLAICRNLVKHMGGQIWVESQVGVGSNFQFTARLEMGDSDRMEDVVLAKDEGQGKEVMIDDRPLSILLVEDSPDNRLLIDFYLKNTSYLLTDAENGQLAVDIFKHYEGCFDLILMDIQMPVMDGYAATRRIREIEQEMRWEPCAITALTASVMEESIYKSYEAGCDAHLEKPIKKDTLLDAIFKHTKNRTLRRSIKQDCARDFAHSKTTEQVHLAPSYLENRLKDLLIMRDAIAGEDYETLRILGHRMKGSGGSYGFSLITEMGASLECAAKTRELPLIEKTIHRIGWYLAELDRLNNENPPED